MSVVESGHGSSGDRAQVTNASMPAKKVPTSPRFVLSLQIGDFSTGEGAETAPIECRGAALSPGALSAHTDGVGRVDSAV